MSKVWVGIPARMGSSRYPGKPLVPILGMPMIQHVYLRAALANSASHVFVATCDVEIQEAIQACGGQAIMTNKDIDRPGLRVAEACRTLPIAADDIVVVAQGDEPLLHPHMIDEAAHGISVDSSVQLGTLVGPATTAEWQDPNEVKVVVSESNLVLYMSRAPIPTNERNRELFAQKQVAVMPFRWSMLRTFDGLEPTPLEEIESIELLRALEHGLLVKAIPTLHSNVSVDTPDGRAEAESAMAADPLVERYLQ